MILAIEFSHFFIYEMKKNIKKSLFLYLLSIILISTISAQSTDTELLIKVNSLLQKAEWAARTAKRDTANYFFEEGLLLTTRVNSEIHAAALLKYALFQLSFWRN